MSTLLAAGHVLIGAKVGPALAGLAKVNGAFAATGAKGTALGKGLTKGLTAPIALGFGLAVKAAADFESSLNDMKAVSGATASQMKKVAQTAKDLGNDAKLPATSAKDAADAMVQLAKGGLTAAQAMKAARGTIMLAAAAGVDNAAAATIQADALNAFGLEASQAGRVADLLAASANSSTAEITDMAQSLAQSSTVAKQANWSIEDTVTALSMLANAGIKGSDAGTSLKTMLMRLQAPMGAGAKAIKEYGLNLRDANGDLLKQTGLAQEFQAKLGGLTKAERDRAMAAIFGSDAIRAGNILLGASAAAIDKQREASTRAGAAQDLANAKMQGFNGSLERFKSAAETAAITVGTILLPHATRLTEGLTGLANGFEQLPPGIQQGIVAFAAAAAVIGPLIILAAKLTVAIKTLGPAFAFATGPMGLFLTAAGLVLGGIIALNGGFGGGASAAQRYRDAMNEAKAALDRLKGAVLGVEQADLAHQQAILEVKSAQQGLRSVQQQVNDGTIKGRDATIALEQAQLRLKQAKLGVRQTSQQAAQAEATETEERKKSVDEIVNAVRAARDKVQQAQQEVMLTRGSTEATTKLKDAQRELAAAQAVAARNSDLLASKMGGANETLKTTRLRAAEAKQKLEEIRSRAVKVTVNTEAAMVNVLNLIGMMLQITSKTVTVTVKPRHLKGSWTVQETLEQIQKASAKNQRVKVSFNPSGSGEMERVMKLSRSVKDAIAGARDNAVSLASTLSGQIGQGLDAILGRKVSALGNTPEAQRIRAIEAAQRATNAARERGRLDAAINGAETPEERAQAQADLNDWLLEQERQALADSLAAQEQKLRDENDAKKTAIERGLADLTDGYNRGFITQQQYLDAFKQLLADSGVSYEQLGLDLGTSFANGFRDAMLGLQDQVRLLGQWMGVGTANTTLEDPLATQLKEWTNRRKTLVANLERVRKAAKAKSGPGEAGITADEKAAIDKAVSALANWDQMKPRRAALGGVIGGSGNTDSVPILAKPGEGILNHRGMSQLMDMAHGGRGGGRETHVHFHMDGNTFLGSDREVARELARLVKPELDRRVTYSS